MLATLLPRLLLPHAASELSIRIAGIEASELMLDTNEENNVRLIPRDIIN
jgi:hypothetical protein